MVEVGVVPPAVLADAEEDLDVRRRPPGQLADRRVRFGIVGEGGDERRGGEVDRPEAGAAVTTEPDI